MDDVQPTDGEFFDQVIYYLVFGKSGQVGSGGRFSGVFCGKRWDQGGLAGFYISFQ